MDVSPKTLREVEFREKLRGYHPEDVDQFLERVAAGIEALQDKLRQTTERAVHAEELANATGETDDALRRTLVLAQKTADAAIEEAREQAAEIVSSAQAQAGSIVGEATEEAARIAADAQRQLRDDLATLEAARAKLLADVSQLEQWIETHRSALTAALGEALHQVEEGVFVSTPAPEVSDVDAPAAPVIAAPLATHGVASTESSEAEAEAGGEAEAQGEADPATADELAAEAATAEARAEIPEEDEGPVIEHDENDLFMAELRRAVTDEEPLGPRDDEDEPAPVAATNDGFYSDDPDANRRFGSRRRRRR